jgi:predicted naringenin-chalcone synthase
MRPLATWEIYRTRGNSSSASVLIVLDQLRSESKRTHIVATSSYIGFDDKAMEDDDI